jgi:hypothetical protein
MPKVHVNHETIKLYNPHQSQDILIDVNIAPLIKAIWDNDIPTNYIWISFSSSINFDKFMDIVLELNDDNDMMIQRITKNIGSVKNRKSTDIDFWYCDINFSRKTQHTHSTVSIRFPQKDYEYVLKKLQNTLKNLYNLIPKC